MKNQSKLFSKKNKIIFISLFVLLIASSSIFIFAQNKIIQLNKEDESQLPKNVNFWSDYPSEILASTIAQRMTNSELLSQILMFGWSGSEPNDLLFQWVDRGLGSVKVFGWNTDDTYLVAKSVNRLQRRANSNRFNIPLFVATDQEGGWIRHVKGPTLITPGNMAIGAGGYPLDAWYSAYYICNEIKALGINMNFAPTIDLFTDHNSTIIGTRSFGEDPEKSGILGAAYAAGSMASGIIPTVKHFPGHGDTSLDSHGKLPVINIDEKTLNTRELVPYEYLIKQNIPAIMSGHLSFPLIDPSGAPASLSKVFLTDILRNRLGYEGLIITDDMQMVGATVFAGSFSNAVKLAIEAGNDIVLSSSTARLNESMWQRNLEEMSVNPEFKNKVQIAVYRILKAKMDYFKSGNAAPLYPEAKDIDNFIHVPVADEFFLSQACRSITIDKKGTLPIVCNDEHKVLLAGSLDSFFNAGKERFTNSKTFRYRHDAVNIDNVQELIDGINYAARDCDTVIICVANEKHQRIAQSLKNSKKKVVIVSTMSPIFSESLNWADSVLLGYSWYCDYTMEAMVAALNGEFEPQAIKPYK